MTAFTDWIGRETHSSDRLDEALARRWLATFDLSQPETAAMPQGIHWCLCVPDTPSASLGEDGHPDRHARQSFLPPFDAPRRMWAGSECEFHAPLQIGGAITRSTRIDAIEKKTGSTGPLQFLTLLHRTFTDGSLAVSEKQTLVYRDAPPAGSSPAPPRLTETSFDETGWDQVKRVTPSPELLFRYSALTFNTHRIHYDADYVRDVENYRGPIVHGPLMASLLLQMVGRQLGSNALASFGFRALSPAIADEELVLAMRANGSSIELGTFAADGRQVLKTQARLQP